MSWGPILFFAVVLVVWYILFIFPQQKQAKERKEIIDAVKPGDEVVTYGGIFCVVKAVEENWFVLTIAEGVDIKAAKEAVVMRREPETEGQTKEAGDGRKD